MLAYAGIDPYEPHVGAGSIPWPGAAPGPAWRLHADQGHAGPTTPAAGPGAAYSGAPGYGVASHRYRTRDAHGIEYVVYGNGYIEVVGGHAGLVGTTYRPGDPSYEVVVARIRASDPNIELALGPASTGATPGTDQKTSWFASILSQFGLDTAEGQAAAAAAIKEEGPQILDAAKSLLGMSGKSLSQLTQRLAVIRARLPQTSNPVKRAKLQAEAQGIQAEISRMQAMQQSAMLGASHPPPAPRGTVAIWLVPTLGVLALGAGVVFVATRKRK
jgi:hypothetical protein